MLVLQRKEREVIVIGDDIRLTVTRIDRGRVELSIDAPPEVEVWRAEIRPDQRRREGKPHE